MTAAPSLPPTWCRILRETKAARYRSLLAELIPFARASTRSSSYRRCSAEERYVGRVSSSSARTLPGCTADRGIGQTSPSCKFQLAGPLSTTELVARAFGTAGGIAARPGRKGIRFRCFFSVLSAKDTAFFKALVIRYRPQGVAASPRATYAGPCERPPPPAAGERKALRPSPSRRVARSVVRDREGPTASSRVVTNHCAGSRRAAGQWPC